MPVELFDESTVLPGTSLAETMLVPSSLCPSTHFPEEHQFHFSVLHWEQRQVLRDPKLRGQTLRAGLFQLSGNGRSTHKPHTAHVFSLARQAALPEEFQNFL